MLLVQLASINYFYSMCQLEGNVFYKVYCYPEILFNRHILELFEASNFKQVRILILTSPVLY